MSYLNPLILAQDFFQYMVLVVLVGFVLVTYFVLDGSRDDRASHQEKTKPFVSAVLIVFLWSLSEYFFQWNSIAVHAGVQSVVLVTASLLLYLGWQRRDKKPNLYLLSGFSIAFAAYIILGVLVQLGIDTVVPLSKIVMLFTSIAFLYFYVIFSIKK